MKKLLTVTLVALFLVGAANTAFAGSRPVNLRGPFATRCVRDISQSVGFDSPRTGTFTRWMHEDSFESRGHTYRLQRTGNRTFVAHGRSGAWDVRHAFTVTRWSRVGKELLGNKFKSTLVGRRTFHGRRLVDYYNCKGTLTR